MTLENTQEWLAAMLESDFDDSCSNHQELKDNKKYYFCIECKMGLCQYCLNSSSTHRHHNSLRIFQKIHRDVVRFNQIKKVLDCSQIKTYLCNNERVVHLKPVENSSNTVCKACQRSLNARSNKGYCSIKCKKDQNENVAVGTITEAGSNSGRQNRRKRKGVHRDPCRAPFS